MDFLKVPEMELEGRVLSVERTDAATIVKVEIRNGGDGGFAVLTLPIAVSSLVSVSEAPEEARKMVVKLGELLASTFKEPGSLA
jgi:hypothetical protein